MKQMNTEPDTTIIVYVIVIFWKIFYAKSLHAGWRRFGLSPFWTVAVLTK